MFKKLFLIVLYSCVYATSFAAQYENLSEYDVIIINPDGERSEKVYCGKGKSVINGKLLYLNPVCVEYSDDPDSLSELVKRVHAVLPRWYKAAVVSSSDCFVSVNGVDYTDIFSSWLYKMWGVGLNNNQVHEDILKLGLTVNTQFIEVAFLEKIYCESLKDPDLLNNGRAKMMAVDTQNAIELSEGR